MPLSVPAGIGPRALLQLSNPDSCSSAYITYRSAGYRSEALSNILVSMALILPAVTLAASDQDHTATDRSQVHA